MRIIDKIDVVDKYLGILLENVDIYWWMTLSISYVIT
jgi:hypothetical protein